jgi:hypothetical protein
MLLVSHIYAQTRVQVTYPLNVVASGELTDCYASRLNPHASSLALLAQPAYLRPAVA